MPAAKKRPKQPKPGVKCFPFNPVERVYFRYKLVLHKVKCGLAEPFYFIKRVTQKTIVVCGCVVAGMAMAVVAVVGVVLGQVSV